LVAADVIDETDLSRYARHAPLKLSNTIAEAYRKYRGSRRRLPRVRLNFDLNRPGNGRKNFSVRGAQKTLSDQEKQKDLN